MHFENHSPEELKLKVDYLLEYMTVSCKLNIEGEDAQEVFEEIVTDKHLARHKEVFQGMCDSVKETFRSILLEEQQPLTLSIQPTFIHGKN